MPNRPSLPKSNRGGVFVYLIFNKKTVISVISAVTALTIAVLTASGIYNNEVITASADGNWGLSFQTEGQPPVANASQEELSKLNAYYIGDTSQKVIYLTFDAGYEAGYTEEILDILKEHNVSATFFVVGNYIETSPETVKRMADEGHTVGNHTYSHPDMSAISDEESFSEELTKLEELYEEVTGQEMLKIYRPPQGKYSESNLETAKSLGYTTVFWSLAYVDWYQDDQPTADEAFSKLIPRIHNGAIVLLHSTSKTNCEILDELLTRWEDMGYSFDSITNLIA